MLDSIITSSTRIKLLLRFFLNPGSKGYLRQLSSEFGESTNGIRVELNKLTDAKILRTEIQGRNKLYAANVAHPLFEDIRNIVLKSTGVDKVVSNIVRKTGNLRFAFLRGDYARGIDSGLIELVVVGDHLNTGEIERVRKKTEDLIDRKISVIVLNLSEYNRLKDHFLSETHMMLYGNKNSEAV
jgi:hypothetical protein